MTRSRPLIFLAGAAAVALSALATVGCGGGGDGATAAPAQSTTANGDSATVGTANEGKLGAILVDSKGRTLYLFKKDAGPRSACTGACAISWPPLRATGKPTVGEAANASLVGTASRSDGKPQVTYNGHPLYLYAGDEKSGDTEGQGVTAFGAAWYVLTPAGTQVSPRRRALADLARTAEVATSEGSVDARSASAIEETQMLAIEMQTRLRELQAERLLAASEGLAANAAYMADLDDEIAEVSDAYVGAAVTEIATLRAELFGPQVG